MIQETINLMGRKAKDKITGFSGIITSTSFDLYGCAQLALMPSTDKDGKLGEGHWFDTNRIELIGEDRVMPVPTFDHVTLPQQYDKGPAEKPPHRALRWPNAGPARVVHEI